MLLMSHVGDVRDVKYLNKTCLYVKGVKDVKYYEQLIKAMYVEGVEDVKY